MLPNHYGMYSNRANRSVQAMLRRVLKAKRAQSDSNYLITRVRAGMTVISKKHGEVYDTDVREQILYALEKQTPIAKHIGTHELY